jgi:ribulose-bisphosphate carboxylase small chain
MTVTRRLGTFSYLPPLTAEQTRAQVEHIVRRRMMPWIEFATDPGPGDHLWSLWRLPMTSEPTVEDVLAEVEACAAANPDAHVRLVGYDARTQNRAVDFVVRVAGSGARPD